MKTHEEWREIFGAKLGWRQKYPMIERIARDHLADVPVSFTWSTRQLVQAMYPDPRGPEGAKMIKELYRVIGVLAEHGMADCAFEGKPYPLYGRIVTPLVWRRQEPRQLMPGEMPAQDVPVVTEVCVLSTLHGWIGTTDGPLRERIAAMLATFLETGEATQPETTEGE
jgi:hypothetical protein